MPFGELTRYHRLQIVLPVGHHVLQTLPVRVLLKFLHLLVHLLEHLHEHLSPHLNFFHRIDLFSDVVAFVVSKERTRVANHISALDTNQLSGLFMRRAQTNLRFRVAARAEGLGVCALMG